MRVPEYGIHNGIKYSPRRTLVRFCELCGTPFDSIGHGKKFCGEECQLEHRQQLIREKHNPINNPINNPVNNFINNDKNNAKWNPINNPINNAKRDKYAWANYWKNWYNSKHPTYKKEYNDKKKRQSS